MCQEKIALYIEDYPEVREDIINDLRKRMPQLKIETADTPTEAEQVLQGKRYDLLFLDIRLADPEKNDFKGTHWTRAGRKLLELLRNGEYEKDDGTLCDVPVIVISAVANRTAREEIIQIGRRDGCLLEYLNKPVGLDKVRETVKKFCCNNR